MLLLLLVALLQGCRGPWRAVPRVVGWLACMDLGFSHDGDNDDDDGICSGVGWVVVVRAFWVMGVWVDVVLFVIHVNYVLTYFDVVDGERRWRMAREE